MPPKKFEKPVTFTNWVEDVVHLPREVADRTLGVIKTDYQNYLVWQAKATAIESDYAEADLIRAFTEGAEAVSDLQGINSTIKVRDLYFQPTKTLKIFGKKTLDDLTNMDDLSGYRRSEVISRLTRGQVTDGLANIPNSKYLDRGQRLDIPHNGILRGLNKSRVIPLNSGYITIDPTGAARSKFHLVKDLALGADPNNIGDWEDRRIAEESPGNRRAEYKPYLNLSGSFSSLSLNLADSGERLRSKNKVNNDFSMGVMQEIGVDLDKVLNTSGGGVMAFVEKTSAVPVKNKHLKNSPSSNMGTLHKTLIEDAGGDISVLLANDNLVAKALDMDFARYKDMAPGMKLTAKHFLEVQELNIRNSFIEKRTTGIEIKARWKNAGLTESLRGSNYPGYSDVYIRGDVQHLMNQASTKFYLEADARIKQVRAEALKDLKTKFGHDPLVYADKKDRLLKRLDALQESTVSANTLFASASIKDALVAIKDGKFIEAALINTRLLGMVPFVDKKMRAPREWGSILSPDSTERMMNDAIKKAFGITNLDKSLAKYLNPVTTIKKVSDNAQMLSGIKVNTDKTNTALNPGIHKWINDKTHIFENDVILEWKPRDLSGTTPGAYRPNYTFMKVKASDGKGLFGPTGVLTLFEKIEDEGLMAGLPGGLPFPSDMQSMFDNLSNIDEFYGKLHEIESFLSTGTPLPNAELQAIYDQIILPLGLHHPTGIDAATRTVSKYGLKDILDGYDQYRTSGKKMLENMSDVTKLGENALDTRDRFSFLQSLRKNGKAGDFANIYAGLLKKFNTYANLVNDFIQKNIIYGTVLTNIPIVGAIFRPFQGLIRGLGFSEELTIQQTIMNWKWMQRITSRGTRLDRMGSLYLRGRGSRIATSAFMKAFTGKLSGKLMGSALKIAALGLKGVTAAITGGLSFIISTLGAMFGKATFKLLRGDVTGAKIAVKEELEGIWKVGKIVIGYPIALIVSIGCILPMGILVIFMTVVIPSTVAPLEPIVGGSANNTTNTSLNIQVTKTGQLSPDGSSIKYTVLINNVSTVPVTITGINDTTSMVGECGEGGSYANTFEYGSSGFIGTYDAAHSFNKYLIEMAPGTSQTIEYTLQSITPDSATYFNEINVTSTSELETGKQVGATMSVDIGEGGCVECPRGWPISDFAITTRPGGSGTHNGIHFNSIDLATSGRVGDPIHATHSGRVTVGYDAGGYGNYVIVTSPAGFHSLYGHMSVVTAASGSQATNGTLIGLVGSTGNSSGPHVHYEFSYGSFCQGIPLKMEPPFTPSY